MYDANFVLKFFAIELSNIYEYDTAPTKYLSHNSALKNFTKQARRSLKLEKK